VSFTRRFLLASSLARLIEKGRDSHRVTEGYFPDSSVRGPYVHVEEGTGSLVVALDGPHGPVEERTELPRPHAKALLDITAGGVVYFRTNVQVGGYDAFMCRFTRPEALDLIVILFEQEEQAQNFLPLPWFGPEVTTDLGYQNRSMALDGPPDWLEVEPTDAALHSLLDTFEGPDLISQVDYTASIAEPAAPPVPSWDAAAEADDEDLGFEDSVIRDLAQALRPHKR
jgi:CYTH domain-containing protein